MARMKKTSMAHHRQERGRAPLSDDEAKALANWLECEGDVAVMSFIGLSRSALYRAAIPLSVHPATRAVVRAALAARGT
ncbi:MAG: hypothetical protein ACRENE_07105 [Polyangiaceae bacterium]